MRIAVMSMGDACTQEEQATMKHRTARHTTPRHVKPTRSCPQWTGKRAQQYGKNTVMPVRKRISNGVKKKQKTVFPHSGHTSNNASNNNGNKHHTRQLRAAVSSLSPIFMAARHRTRRESIAPPPSSFLPTAHNRVHPHPSPRRPQRPNSQPPKNRCGNHTPATKHATQHHVTWTPPSKERHVNRLAGTRYNRSTEQRSKAGTQSRTLHAHSPFDAAAAAMGTVPERKMTRSKKGLTREKQSTRPYAKRHSGCCGCRVRGQKCALLNPASYVSLPSHQCSA
ncbi:hypothetical protein TCSYLVIO_005175 [Trypanosoma cruzi]|nr:hypothetical protein TCSYLVIO_005175 [Trypanosoma cruzi]